MNQKTKYLDRIRVILRVGNQVWDDLPMSNGGKAIITKKDDMDDKTWYV